MFILENSSDGAALIPGEKLLPRLIILTVNKLLLDSRLDLPLMTFHPLLLVLFIMFWVSEEKQQGKL